MRSSLLSCLLSFTCPLFLLACGGQPSSPSYPSPETVPPTPPPTPPPPTRDLVVKGFSIRHSSPLRPDDIIYFCLNRDFQTGAARSDGNFIQIANQGNADAAGYQVQIGLERNGTLYGCRDLLYSLSTPAGQTTQWNGPYCCSFGLGTVPTGDYRIFVSADINQNVSEVNESNNLLYGADLIHVP